MEYTVNKINIEKGMYDLNQVKNLNETSKQLDY